MKVCNCRDLPISTSAGDLATDCPQSGHVTVEVGYNAKFESGWIYCEKSAAATSLPSSTTFYRETDMSSRFEKNRQLANAGTAHRNRLQEGFRAATEALDTQARTMPGAGDKLREEQDNWVAAFGGAMVRGWAVG